MGKFWLNRTLYYPFSLRSTVIAAGLNALFIVLSILFLQVLIDRFGCFIMLELLAVRVLS